MALKSKASVASDGLYVQKSPAFSISSFSSIKEDITIGALEIVVVVVLTVVVVVEVVVELFVVVVVLTAVVVAKVVDIVVVVVGNVMVDGLNVEGELNLTPFVMEFLI